MYKVKLDLNGTVQTRQVDNVDTDSSGNLVVTDRDQDDVIVYNQHVWISYKRVD